MLPARVLDLIAREHPAAVKRYREANGLSAPDERNASEQDTAQDAPTPTSVEERKRPRARK
jgi:hypothetical protein